MLDESQTMPTQFPDAHQEPAMQLAPVERVAGWHRDKKQKPPSEWINHIITG